MSTRRRITYKSTRGGIAGVTFEVILPLPYPGLPPTFTTFIQDAVFMGLAPDKGLLIPDVVPVVSADELNV